MRKTLGTRRIRDGLMLFEGWYFFVFVTMLWDMFAVMGIIGDIGLLDVPRDLSCSAFCLVMAAVTNGICCLIDALMRPRYAYIGGGGRVVLSFPTPAHAPGSSSLRLRERFATVAANFPLL